MSVVAVVLPLLLAEHLQLYLEEPRLPAEVVVLHLHPEEPRLPVQEAG